jgi:hypothetical protein
MAERGDSTHREELDRLGAQLSQHYAGDDAKAERHFISRRPFLINKSVKTRRPQEQESLFEQHSASAKIANNDVFLGIAGFKSFDIVAQAGADSSYQNIVLFDVNQRQIEAMDDIVQLIASCENREEFLVKFREKYPDYMRRPPLERSTLANKGVAREYDEFFNVYGANKEHYQPQTIESLDSYIASQLGSRESWLNNYDVMHSLAREGKIKVVHLDLRDPERVHTLKAWLDAKGLHVGHMYLSSVMSFMDPKFKTDYHSHQATLPGIRKFYDDLLSMGDEKTSYIVSVPDEKKAFMQDYYLETRTREQIREMKKALPKSEPQPEERLYDFMFTAATGTPNEQVFRIMTFRDSTGERYYRVATELPSIMPDELYKQIDGINYLLGNINSRLRTDRKPTIELLPEQQFNGTHDHQYFAMEEEAANRNVMHPRSASRGVHLSSQPFRLTGPGANDPAATLAIIQQEITRELSPTRPEGLPVVVVNRPSTPPVPGLGGGAAPDKTAQQR